MELTEGVPLQKSSGMRPGDYPFEQLTGEPDGATSQASVRTEINTEIMDKLGHELCQLNIVGMHPIRKEGCDILSSLLHGSK